MAMEEHIAEKRSRKVAQDKKEIGQGQRENNPVGKSEQSASGYDQAYCETIANEGHNTKNPTSNPVPCCHRDILDTT